MVRVEIICEECGSKSTIEIKGADELPDVVCPKCRNPHIWFTDIENNGEDFVLPGTGGCGRTG